MTNTEYINFQINQMNIKGESTKEISDGHHTFKELYEQRMILFMALCNQNKEISWKSKKHYDEENDPMFEGDFIAGITTEKGDITYHLKLEYWDDFTIKELERAPKYDGDTPSEVLEKVKVLK